MVGAPKLVRGCTVLNETNGPVQVSLHYKKLDFETANAPNHIQQGSIPRGGSHRSAERIIKDGSAEFFSNIEKVQVTLADGQTHIITEPFDGVNGIEGNWLFVVYDTGIRSVSSA